MVDQIRCGNCGQFAGVEYRWFGAHYGETISCGNCGPSAYEYDEFAEYLAGMSADELREEGLI